uniref:Chromosome 1 C1orf35 homolog n=1 Tax=Macaca mulatta TaxID=9544 RepID=A0A5F7ZQ96_MACMU
RLTSSGRTTWVRGRGGRGGRGGRPPGGRWAHGAYVRRQLADGARRPLAEGPRPHLVRQGPGAVRGPEPRGGTGSSAGGGAGGAAGRPWLQEREEAAHGPEQGGNSLEWGARGGPWVWGRPERCLCSRTCRISRRSASGKEATPRRRAWTGCWGWGAPGASRFPGEGRIARVRRALDGLSSSPCSCSGSVGRVAMSREDKEAAKLGLSVFTHHRVESGGPGTSATSARRKPRAEDQTESSSESHRKSKKEKKKKKKKKHKKEKKKKDKEHRQPAEAASSPTSPERPRHHHDSYSNSPCCKRRKRGHSGDRRSPSRRWHDRGSEA